MESNNRFWIVWCPTGPTTPHYRHSSKKLATTEAMRLAGDHPGREFFVLEAVGRAAAPDPVKWTELEVDADIPF